MSRLFPYQFHGGLAVVTGDASGIGEQLAKHLAIRGSNLHLIDRDEARLVTLASGAMTASATRSPSS
jgi:short-subunit dehydrogenase